MGAIAVHALGAKLSHMTPTQIYLRAIFFLLAIVLIASPLRADPVDTRPLPLGIELAFPT